MNVNTKKLITSPGKLLKVFPVFFLLWMLSNPLMAQFTEIGGGVGTMNYLGDLPYKAAWHQPAVNVFLRTNLSPAVSVKYGVTIGRVKASVMTDSLLPSIESNQVGMTYIGEGSAVFEYNFLDYSRNKGDFRFTPYVFGGAGFFYMSGPAKASNLQPVIPFGIGIKQMLGKQWNLGIEAGLRKTFTDKLDNYSEDIGRKDFHANSYSKDYYYFVGFNLSYTFFNVLCP